MEGDRAAPPWSRKPDGRLVHPVSSSALDPEVLGSQGAVLAHLRSLGLPVVAHFTIGTAARGLPAEPGRRDDGDTAALRALTGELNAAIAELEEQVGMRFDDTERPLLVRVELSPPEPRAGVPAPVPYVGLSNRTAAGVSALASPAFADEARRRLVTAAGGPLPDTGREQLAAVVRRLWRAWHRAAADGEDASAADGAAIVVRAELGWAHDERSGRGVLVTRDPTSGSPLPYGEFTPAADGARPARISQLHERLPQAARDLQEIAAVLEASFRDVCEARFSLDGGVVWLEDAHVAQPSASAAVRIAVDLVDDGLLDVDRALARIPLSAIRAARTEVAVRGQDLDVLARGEPAAGGVATGVVVFEPAAAAQRAEQGVETILVQQDAEEIELSGLAQASGLITVRGSGVSTAAAEARRLGRPAVCGVPGMEVDRAAKLARFAGGRMLHEGDVVTVDGNTGTICAGQARTVPAQPDARLARLLAWCQERQRVPVVNELPPGFEGPVVVVPAREADRAELMERLAAAPPTSPTALVLPADLLGDLRPPAAAWSIIVAPRAIEEAGVLLSARLPTRPSSAGDRDLLGPTGRGR